MNKVLYSPLGFKKIGIFMENEGEVVILKINFYYVGGSRLPLRAPHIFGVKTKQKIINNLKIKNYVTDFSRT